MRILFCVLFALLTVAVQGQSSRISGTVQDAASGAPLPYASLTLEGTAVGVVANAEGEFTLAIPASYTHGHVLVSYLGYEQQRHPLVDLDTVTSFRLKEETVEIEEVSVEAQAISVSLPQRVLNAIPTNYPQLPVMLTGFYRNQLTLNATNEEYLFAEAVLQMYKAPYDYSFDEDQVKLLKGRRKTERYALVSQDGKYAAEIPYLVSGPQAGTRLDVIAQRPPFLNELTLEEYRYTLREESTFEVRPLYVLDFEPKDSTSKSAHSAGTLYIDQNTFALVRAEFHTHPARIQEENRKGGELLVLSQSHTVQYRLVESLWFLQFVQSETEYRSRTTGQRLTLKLEFLVTDMDADNVRPFKQKEILSESDVLTKYVGTDSDLFWEDYNIIR